MVAADVISKMKENESAVTQTSGDQEICFVPDEVYWLTIPKILKKENCSADTISKAMQQIMAMEAGYLNNGDIYQQYCYLSKTLAEKYPGELWIPQEDKYLTPEKIKRTFREGHKMFSFYARTITSLLEKLKANRLPLTSLWEQFEIAVSEPERVKKSHNKYEPMLLCVCVCVLKICV